LRQLSVTGRLESLGKGLHSSELDRYFQPVSEPAGPRAAAMFDRHHVLGWTLPLGSLGGVPLRVSWLWLGTLLVLLYQLPWQIAGAFWAILFLSSLLHELGHLAAARFSGGYLEELLVWPLGGLTATVPGPFTFSVVATSLGGIFVNAWLVLMFYPAWYVPAEAVTAMELWRFPVLEYNPFTFGRDLCWLAFYANAVQLTLNVLPLPPLDGGRLLAGWLRRRAGENARPVMVAVAWGGSWALLMTALMLQLPWLAALAAITLLSAVMLSASSFDSDRLDDSFMGYDFSQGYTSLERAESRPSIDPSPSWFQRWQQERAAKKAAQEAEYRARLESQLDVLLEKVHANGLNSLADDERRLLKQASDLLRSRARRQP
jgi:stage IV sporulation protein FB